MANGSATFEGFMAIIRKYSWLALVLLAACQSKQFIPVNVPANHTQVASDATRPILMSPSTVSTVTPSAAAALPERPTDQTESTPAVIQSADCVKVTFIGDVSIPDGTALMAGELFLKIWRLRNTGVCAWPEDLELVFIAGDPMGGTLELQARYYQEGVPLIASLGERQWVDSRLAAVAPGEIIDLPVFFLAPDFPGDYFSLWGLRSDRIGAEVIQIYLQIRVKGPETPEPSTWGGVWSQLNSHAENTTTPLNLEQRGAKLSGYFYSTDGELYLLEGGLFDQDTRVEGTFGPPYHDGYPFTWQLMTDGRSFQGTFRDRIVSAGAWCGSRSEADLPNPCALAP